MKRVHRSHGLHLIFVIFFLDLILKSDYFSNLKSRGSNFLRRFRLLATNLKSPPPPPMRLHNPFFVPQ